MSELQVEPDVERITILITDRKGDDLLRFRENGEVLYKGKLIENDKQIVDGLRDLLQETGFWNVSERLEECGVEVVK